MRLAESEENQQHVQKRWMVVTVIAVLALVFLIPFIRQGGARVDTSVEVETVPAEIGNIRETTSGAGKITGMEHWDVAAPFSGVLAAWRAPDGAQVQQGDVLALYDTQSIDEEIDDTLTRLEELDDQIQALGKQTDFTLTAEEAGVVKELSVSRGDDTQGQTLALLSTDGLLRVSFICEESKLPEKGKRVTIYAQSERYEGIVEDVEGQTVTVTLEDEGDIPLETEAEVLNRVGDVLGQGKVELNAPLEITSERSGIVAQVLCAVGDEVDEGQALIQCIDTGLQDNCQELVEKRRETVELLLSLRSFRDKPEILAENTGVVSNIEVKEGEILKQGEMLCRISSQNQYLIELTVPVRNADRIKAGQRVLLHFGEQTFDGTVARDVSDTDRGSAVCNVLATMESDGNHRVGEETKAEIILGERNSVVLIPAKTVTLEEDGTETVDVAYGDGLNHSCSILTGLNNGTMVEVVEGIEEGDQIVVSSRIVETTFYSLFNHEWIVNQKEGPSEEGLVSEEETPTEEETKPD